MTDTGDDEISDTLREAAEALGVSAEYLAEEKKRAERLLDAMPQFLCDTAGTTQCDSCGGEARWTRDGSDLQITCTCGFEAHCSVPQKAN